MPNQFHLDGVQAFKENKYEQAKSLFLQAIAESPEEPTTHFNLGQTYFYLTEYEHAITSLDKFIQLVEKDKDPNENLASAYDTKGQCFIKQHKPDEALVCYDKALQVNPNYSSAIHNKGLYFLGKAHDQITANCSQSKRLFQQAQRLLSTALTFSKNNPMFLHSLAKMYEQYIDWLNAALKEHHGDHEFSKQKVDYFKMAIEQYRTALFEATRQNDPAMKNIITSGLTECLVQYGHHFYQLEQYEEAKGLYLQALGMDTKYITALHQMGMTLIKLGKLDTARSYFSKITNQVGQLHEEDPTQDYADAWSAIAYTFRLEKNFPEAEKAIAEAKKLAPNDQDIAKEEVNLLAAKTAALLVNSRQTLHGSSVGQRLIPIAQFITKDGAPSSNSNLSMNNSQ